MIGLRPSSATGKELLTGLVLVGLEGRRVAVEAIAFKIDWNAILAYATCVKVFTVPAKCGGLDPIIKEFA